MQASGGGAHVFSWIISDLNTFLETVSGPAYCHLLPVDSLSRLTHHLRNMKSGVRNIRVQFGQAVRKQRLKIGLSQEGLAEKANMHRTYVADIERGVRNVSLVNIEKLALALGCSIGDLADDPVTGGRQ